MQGNLTRAALLSAGLTSLLSSTCHSIPGHNYRRLTLAPYLEREERAELRFSILAGNVLVAVTFSYIIRQLKEETESLCKKQQTLMHVESNKPAVMVTAVWCSAALKGNISISYY